MIMILIIFFSSYFDDDYVYDGQEGQLMMIMINIYISWPVRVTHQGDDNAHYLDEDDDYHEWGLSQCWWD